MKQFNNAAMNPITVSAPGKLMLFGEHAVVYGHPCIVTAVGQRMFLTVQTLNSKLLTLNSPEVNVTNYSKLLDQLGEGEMPKGARFIEIAVKNFSEKYTVKSGLQITTRSEFASTFGFGSSSASTVCTIKALSELFDLKLSNKEIFDLSYKTVLDVQGKGSGFDVAAAIYGGSLLFFTGGKEITPLTINHLPVIIGYSGIKADTVRLIEKVAEKAEKEPEVVEDIYKRIEQIVEKAKTAIEKSDFEEAGKLMTENQLLLSQLDVSSEKLDAMIQAARDAGAYGAKLSGAGGGDCMIALRNAQGKPAVEKAIERVGGQVIDVETNVEGVRVENKQM
ncbi:MAG: mevalonate kinase [bacterium]|nr:mevalonate kinase [bacterium]